MKLFQYHCHYIYDFRYNRYNTDDGDVVHYGGGGCSSSDLSDFINDDPRESDYEASQDDNSAAGSVPASERASSLDSTEFEDSDETISSEEGSPKPCSSGPKLEFTLLSQSDFESEDDTRKQKLSRKHKYTIKDRNSKVYLIDICQRENPV